jgi:transcriptional regulator with GAF, ATPase, and Fis domain
MMGEAARSCRWLEDSGAAPLPAHHNVDLQQLVRALGERADVELLLAKVVDVLIMWTGAERGLFLLRTKSGKLVPRAARNLARRDLEREQLAVSTSLAERALALGEPVVAVDAMSELSDSHASVHALELRSILVLPLVARGNVVGVVYLDDRFRKGAFGEREVAWAKNAAPIAAVAIADARTQRALRRAVKKARRAGKELAEALAYKETALVVAETELAKQTSLRRTRFRYDEIVGESEPVQRMLSLIDRIAESDVPVMLHGESGSGKELVARAVHRHSARARRAFVGENCGALPETLLESALFGHVRGAFTGAHGPRVGLFEAADGGTLFLDEIGEMSLGMQTKLLRVLEDGMVRPVGSERARRVDVRVIAATHRDLDKMVEAQTFREDLFYRLNVITVRVPALRERASDIPLLVQHLIHKHAPDRKVRVSATAKRSLMAHRWPGNIRQLENEVRRALLLCDDVIDVDHLSFQQREDAEEAEQGLDVRARVDRLERDLVKQALGQTRGNQTKAAKLLGLSRFGLHKLMKRLGIDAR